MSRLSNSDSPPRRKRMSGADRRRSIADTATEVFGERGYHGSSIEEIARRSGVSVPVIYDHFPSKRNLYEHLIEEQYRAMRGIWLASVDPDLPVETWIPSAVDAWFAYVERHQFAGRLLFRDTTGDPDIAAAHRCIQDASRDDFLPVVAKIFGLDPNGDRLAVELVWESFKSALQGLALWWYEHPEVPRERLVSTAISTVWVGLEASAKRPSWSNPLRAAPSSPS